MKINVEHIQEKPLSMHGAEPLESFPVLVQMQDDGECRFTGPIRYDITAAREYDHIRVSGRVSTPLVLTCSRCLVDYESAVDSSFTIVFRRGTQVEAVLEGETELSEQDLVSAIYSGEEIDLTHEIEEQVAMDVPLKALCREECQGLCPDCGADLNQANCSCPKEKFNFKFSALKDFKAAR